MNTFRPDLITNIEDITVNEWRDFLLDVCEVNEEVIDCMCAIHGYTIETLDDVCYWKFGMTCEQMMEELNEGGC